MNPGTITKKEIHTAFELLKIAAEAICKAGSVPSGTLYATMMSVIDLPGYNRAIEILINAKLVKKENHLLTWIGPAYKEEQTAANPQ